MEAVQQLSFRLRAVRISLLRNSASAFVTPSPSASDTTSLATSRIPVFTGKCFSSTSKAGWFTGLGVGGNQKSKLPSIVKAGDPVLHERAREVEPSEMKLGRVQNIIDDMIKVMRKAPGVGLAAPQIGIPLRVKISFSMSMGTWVTHSVIFLVWS